MKNSDKQNPKSSDDAAHVEQALPTERIAKRMARAGLCSRRDAERWIEDGRVVLNGKKLTTPACVVSQTDRIEVDGKPLPGMERTRLWLLNKRAGQVTTNKDPEGRLTIFERLPADLPRVMSVGRLDINTEGLLLLTNDGGLSRILELPSTGWLRRYRVRAHGSVTQEQLDKLADGIAVDGVLYGSIEATLEREQGTNVWLTFAMREGKNREVKKVLAALDLDVNRLIRISYGPFQLGDIPAGEVMEVRSKTLRDQLGQGLIEAANANFDAPIVSNKKVDGNAAKNSSGAKSSDKSGNSRKTKKVDPLSRLDTRRRPEGSSKRNGRNAKPSGGAGADRRR